MFRQSTRDVITALSGVAVAGAAAFAWGSLVERKLYSVRRVSVPVLPPGSKDIRILHLSDFHLAPWQHDKIEWIRSLIRFEPDLIVNTGDNLGHRDSVASVEAALEPFRGTPGVFVNGSNDYFAPTFKNPLRYFMGPSKHNKTVPRLNTSGLMSVFDSLGWADLNNRAAVITVNGTRVEFFGVDDPHRHLDKLELISGELDALHGDSESSDDSFVSSATRVDSASPAEPGTRRSLRRRTQRSEEQPVLTIGVAHAPYQRVLKSFVTHGAEVIFAGHTHGGQVCVPFFGAIVTNCDIPRRQVKGLSTWRHGFRSAYLNVSAGLVTSIYAPVRFACPPEVTLMTLTSTR